jgi:riboflavin kinase/FMN adenylyltransferase
MKIIPSLNKLEREDTPCSLALGAFDGLHRGHMAVIHAACAPGKEGQEWEPAVFTFHTSPSGNCAVLTGRDKERILEHAGVRRLYSLDFQEVRDWEAETFVRELLFHTCNARRLCCGEDFRFGKGARGDVAMLGRLCEEAGVELYVVPPVTDGGEKVSSTRIRKAVEEGDIPLANRLLGRPFGFSLEVIHGNHIGGTVLGTPTINQAIPEGFVLPRFGVYASWCRVGGRYFYGVTNVGVKPTVGSDKVLAETWMPDFTGDLYGKRVRVFLLEFLRPEKKFDSMEELKAAIGENGRQAKAVAARIHPPVFPAGNGWEMSETPSKTGARKGV